VPLDFFETTSHNVPLLNNTERQLYEYVLRNMDTVKELTIQKFAANHFLSTTTIFRFTKKLGFSGYSEFINSLLITTSQKRQVEIPGVLKQKTYSEEYLKNVLEAVRVMPSKKIEQIHKLLDKKPNIYILTDESAHDIGRYCEKIFVGIGMTVYFPETGYQIQAMLDRIEDNDLLIVLSYSAREPALLEAIDRIFSKKKPFLLSITRADNNSIQNISDVNFYIFVDEVVMNNINLTTQVPILMLLELIIFEYIASKANLS